MKKLLTASVLMAAALLLSGCANSSSAAEDAQMSGTDPERSAADTTSAPTKTDDAAATEATTASAPADPSSTAETADSMTDERAEGIYQMGYKQGYIEGLNAAHYAEVYLTGDFTATVRAVLPDYVADLDTPRVAVVTLFQAGPILIRMDPEIAGTLEPEKTYTFVLKGQQIRTSTDAWDQETGNISDSVINGLLLDLSEVREPEEDEYGLECCRLSAVAVVAVIDNELTE